VKLSKSKSKRIAFITPAGTAKYPHITEKDTGHKYSSNKYDSRLIVDAEEAKPFIKLVQDAAKDAGLDDPKLPFKLLEDGTVEIKAKSTYQPAIFDSRNKKIDKLPQGTRVAGGSTIRMAGTLNVYDKGVSLWLNQVQIIELVDGQGKSMFEQTDGFVRDELDDDEDTGSFGDANNGGPDI
jgi:hypothetical protein